MALALIQGWGMALCEQWVPQYLLESWHFDIKLSGWVCGRDGAGAMVLGALVGGYAADRSLNHSGNIRSAHQVVPGIGFLLAALSLMLLPIGEHEGAIAFWLGLALFGLQAAGTMLWVFAIDIGGRHTGVSAGCIGLGLLLARLLSPMLLFGLARSLPAVMVVTMLVLAGVLSFRLRPHIELPVVVPEPTIGSEPEDEAGAEIDELLESSGQEAARLSGSAVGMPRPIQGSHQISPSRIVLDRHEPPVAIRQMRPITQLRAAAHRRRPAYRPPGPDAHLSAPAAAPGGIAPASRARRAAWRPPSLRYRP